MNNYVKTGPICPLRRNTRVDVSFGRVSCGSVGGVCSSDLTRVEAVGGDSFLEPVAPTRHDP